MGKPFQFSLRNMLFAVTLFCVWISSLVSFTVAVRYRDVASLAFLLVALLTSVGGAIGAIVGRPLAGAGLALVIGLPLYCVIFVMVPAAFGFRF
ncbi:MAG TPA: hypothetical protein VGH32_05550 [Pirellulales bacterium]